MRAAPRTQRGFALLVVLWTVGTLALLLSQTLASGRAAMKEAAALRDQAMAAAAADGAIHQGVFRLLNTPSTQQPRPFSTRIGGSLVAVSFEDETGKINPNTASPHLLSGLLRVLGVEPSRAQSLAMEIVDWRTPSPEALAGGLKIDRYRAAGLSYAPSGRLFRSLDELALLAGMTPDIAALLRPHLCLYLDSAVNPRAASRVTAAALEAASMDPSAMEDAVFVTPEQVVTVHAEALGPGRVRFARSAIVRLPPGGGQGQPVAQILTWAGR